MMTLPVITKEIMDKSKYVRCTEIQIIKFDTPPLITSSYPVRVMSANNPIQANNDGKETLFRMFVRDDDRP